MERIVWLAEQADSGFTPAPFATFPDDAASEFGELRLDSAYRTFLGMCNGLYAFSRALHIFGVDSARPFHNLRDRNREAAWRRAYGPAAEGFTFFAEDVFGNLFAIRKGEAFSFDPETAKIAKVGNGFGGWLEYLVGDLSYATGGGVAQVYSEGNGPIPFDMRLSPIKPFVLGGEYDLENLRPLHWEKSLEFRSEVCRQIRDLPEGANIEIRLP